MLYNALITFNNDGKDSPYKGIKFEELLRKNMEIHNKNLKLNFNESEDPSNKQSRMKEFSKKDYTEAFKKSRKKFIEGIFGDSITKIFDKLEQNAKQNRDCDIKYVLELPEHFCREKVESTLLGYFRDLGYNASIGEQMPEKIVIHLS